MRLLKVGMEMTRGRIRRSAAFIAVMALTLGLTTGSSGAATAPSVAFGVVGSVNGVATLGTCGVAGASGSFTLVNPGGSKAVSVTGTTRYLAGTSPSFAKVCVGRLAGAVGTWTGSAVAARYVAVPPSLPSATGGIVSAVNGSTAPGTCGTAGASGTLTLTTRTGLQSVAVTPSTAFTVIGASSSSFGQVCVGGLAGAIGTASGTTLQATRLLYWSGAI